MTIQFLVKKISPEAYGGQTFPLCGHNGSMLVLALAVCSVHKLTRKQVRMYIDTCVCKCEQSLTVL